MSKIKKANQLHWTTQQRKVSSLIPYEHNPRFMTEKQAQELRNSIAKFNLVEIPAINTDGTVLAGHMRLKILELDGRADEMIDVRVPSRELTPEEVSEYNIRSNKNTGQWDFDILLNNNTKEFLFDIGFKPFDFGIVEDKEETKSKEKRYSMAYEIIFETEQQLSQFREHVKTIRKSDPEAPSDAIAILNYLTKHLA